MDGVYSKITLRDKIGQMLLLGFDGKQIDAKSDITKDIEKYNIGGVILFDYNSHTKTFNKNIESPEQVKQLNNHLKFFNVQGNIKYHRPHLPLLIAIDYEGGQVNRLNERYQFPKIPSAAEIGKGDVEKANSTASLMAQTLEEAGFNLNFAPSLDVNVNPHNPIIGKKERSFSSDPTEVAKFADIYSRHFLKHNIQCAYKHFPGHGSSSHDSHLDFVDVTETWRPIELIPYRQLFNSDVICNMVMTAHIVNRQLDTSGLPATLSHKILTGLLRKQLNFKGVIITDDMQMKAISDHYGVEQAVVLAINAGVDMLIFGNNLTTKPQRAEALINLIEEKVQSGEITEARINNAYEHIMAFKQQMKNK